MHHQFKELANIDITEQPMEVGPTTHYVMGGVRVDPESQMSCVPGLFAAGECGGGLHGSNRLGGNSLSDLLVFGKRAGQFAADFAKSDGGARINEDEVEEIARRALEPFERAADSNGESPYQVQYQLQESMQDLVGIVRNEQDMLRGLKEIERLRERVQRVGVQGNREFNPGWHAAIELSNLLTVSEAITRAALRRKESRGAQFREDYPEKDESFSKHNIVVQKGPEGEMQVRDLPILEMPAELQQIIEEMQ
jgi:succinate dehydrogenase / fumarate reductase flavoprotein subunit